jgi:fluoroquinolone resistance protein
MDLTDHLQQIYDDQTFKDGDYPKVEFCSKEFNDCPFIRCTFTEASFQGCIFRNCKFKDCDLSLIRIQDSLFAGTTFEDCKVVGVNWAEARWTQAGLLDPSVHFTGCSINYSTFIGVNLKKAVLTKCMARDVDFSEANLTGANCTCTDFAESRFSQTNLTEADFTHATNYAINVHQNKIKGAKFSLPEAMALLYSLDIILVE